jgi:hypothetical protein
MNVNCEWITANFEGYFSDRLHPEEKQIFHAHIQVCSNCREELRQLNDTDPLIRNYFKHQLAVAHIPVRRRAWLIPAGVAAAFATLFVLLPMLKTSDVTVTAPAPATTAPAAASAPEVGKVQEESPILRAKPQSDNSAAELNASGHPEQERTVDFLVTDPAGYSSTIENYRGRMLLFGVWSTDQPHSISNLERVYQTFGSNTKVRILGVSNQRGTKPAGTTFPVVYNQGSRLLGTGIGRFVLLDETGSVRLRGSLAEDYGKLVATLGDALR